MEEKLPHMTAGNQSMATVCLYDVSLYYAYAKVETINITGNRINLLHLQ
jgi:hypothetical protein